MRHFGKLPTSPKYPSIPAPAQPTNLIAVNALLGTSLDVAMPQYPRQLVCPVTQRGMDIQTPPYPSKARII